MHATREQDALSWEGWCASRDVFGAPVHRIVQYIMLKINPPPLPPQTVFAELKIKVEHAWYDSQAQCMAATAQSWWQGPCLPSHTPTLILLNRVSGLNFRCHNWRFRVLGYRCLLGLWTHRVRVRVNMSTHTHTHTHTHSHTHHTPGESVYVSQQTKTSVGKRDWDTKTMLKDMSHVRYENDVDRHVSC
jgi:hypothetical protein